MNAPLGLSADQRETYRRFAALALPRHTSYPATPTWSSSYGPKDFRRDLTRSLDLGRDLSVYVHVPFCASLCYYCACTKEIVPIERRRHDDPSKSLLRGLDIEARRYGELVQGRSVQQVHLGGGSPTFLHPDDLRELAAILRRAFSMAKGEWAVEIDPRVTSVNHLAALRQAGFNRVSLGIQDFSPRVQKAVNRVQSIDLVTQCVAWCRELDFESINFDLIYGLPFQTLDSMADTLDQSLRLKPDRIAFYRLAVLPDMFRWQRVFHPEDLPMGDLSLDLCLLGINTLVRAGYEFIGLDHFARPGEGLSRAAAEGTLQRNFQGMTTGKELDLIGLGPSAISQCHLAFAQNAKSRIDWQRSVCRDLPIERGLTLSRDDRLRREVLQHLYGYGVIDKRSLERDFEIDFDDYFFAELQRLEDLEREGLVELHADCARLTVPLGRLLMRVVAAVFDRYLPPNAYREGLPAAAASQVG